MLKFFIIILKGFAMGIANIIPGVSGGTIALITNIYEDLINTIKSFNWKAIRLFVSGDFKKLSNHINLHFLLSITLGLLISIFSIAKLFSYLLIEYPIQIWAYFFGLVLASIYFVGKTISQWNWKNIFLLILGAGIALAISFMNPSPNENTNYLFIFICGVIGICGMILPGLSGSYILILLGNYQLLMVTSINSLLDFFRIILSGRLESLQQYPEMINHLIYILIFLLGSIIGIMTFSHLISWIFKKYRNSTLAILTGFVFGSLSIIWPWKKELYNSSLLNKNGEAILIGYERYFPTIWNTNDIWGIFFIIIGITSIIIIEHLANNLKV